MDANDGSIDRSNASWLPTSPYVPTPTSDNARDEHPRAITVPPKEGSKRSLSHSRIPALATLRRSIRNESEKITRILFL